MKQKLVILGGSGYAREVRWLAADISAAPEGPEYEFIGYVVSDLDALGEHDSKDEVLGDETWLKEHAGEVDALALGIGTPAARVAVSERVKALVPSVPWPSLVHPTAQFDRGSCEVGEGVLICAGVIGTVNLVFEPFAMVNLSCTIGHEARLGRGCVLNPTVNISGGVTLGEGVLIGTGAQVLQYLNVGRGATVGAGAVATKDVEPGQVVVGMPAKPLRRG